MKSLLSLSLLRKTALIILFAGALGSLGLTLYAGRNNNSVFLRILFANWVLSPFVALLVAYLLSRRWLVLTRAALYGLMIVLTIGALASYIAVLNPPAVKPAFVFLVIPLISWLFIAIVIPVAALLSRKASRKSNNA